MVVINMKQFPDLGRLKIHTVKDKITVQAIFLSPLKYSNTFIYDHYSAPETFRNIRSAELSQKIFALIYELPADENQLGLFSKLEEITKNEDGSFNVGILHEHTSNFANVFLLVNKEDKSELGLCFKGAKLAIFQFEYQELFGLDCGNYIRYIKSFSIGRGLLNDTAKAINSKKQSLISKIETLNCGIAQVTGENNQLKRKVETAKMTVKQLFARLSEIQLENALDCLNCKCRRKNVVFLPCADVVLCRECLESSMNLTVNTFVKKHKLCCPRCGTGIKEVREMFY